MPTYPRITKCLWQVVVVLALTISLTSSALAADIVWTGAGNGSTWSDINNWELAGGGAPPDVPGSGDTITFNSDVQVTLSASRVVDSVTVDASSAEFLGGGTYSLTTSNLIVPFWTTQLRMGNSGDRFYVTSSINMWSNTLYLSGPGYFHVQGANNINGIGRELFLINDTRLYLNGDQTINWRAFTSGDAGTEIILSNSATLTIYLPENSTIDSAISGNGGIELDCDGGNIQMRGAHTYNGSTTINYGGLTTLGDDRLPIDTDLFIDAGAWANLSSQTVSSLTGSGGLVVINGQTFRLNGDGNYTFNGNISGTVSNSSLEKDGAGTATLTGSINPDVIVTDGTLVVTNGPIAGSLTINGGSFAPGNGIGAISVGTGLFMQAGGALNIGVSGGTADRVNVTGSVNLNNGTLSISGTPTVGATYTIIDNDGADAVAGAFTGLPEGQTFASGGYQYEITYVGGDGNDVVLTCTGVASTPPSPTPDPEPEPDPDPKPDPKPAPKPGTPTGSSPSPTTSLNGPSLSWPRVSGAGAYWVYRAACPTCPKEEIGRVRDTSFVDQSALPGQVYYYFVRGEGSGGKSGFSNWIAAWRYEQNPGRAGDFNGDGIADLLWWEPETNELKIWLMKDGAVQAVVSPGAGQDISQWLLINTGDFNQDGVCDIMWWNPQAGAVEVWYMAPMQGAASGADGSGFQATSSPGQIIGNSTLSYTGDLNGDGRADILWRNYETGQVTLWIMGADGQPQLNGPPTLAAGMTGGNSPGVTGCLEWGVRGLFDMDGDGKDDVIWQHATDGRVVVWRMDGSHAVGTGHEQRAQSDNWLVAGMGDLDGDGNADFVWHNQVSGAIQTWLVRGFFTDEQVIVEGSADAAQWRVKAVGDFCAPGCDDVYLKHSESEKAKILTLDGQEFTPLVE